MRESFATVEEFTAYMGAGATIPANADRLLLEASVLLDHATLGRTRQSLWTIWKGWSIDYKENLRDACCAQVEYWLQIDPQMDILGMPTGFSVMSVKVDHKFEVVAPRAYRYLFTTGLLNRGVRIR